MIGKAQQLKGFTESKLINPLTTFTHVRESNDFTRTNLIRLIRKLSRSNTNQNLGWCASIVASHRSFENTSKKQLDSTGATNRDSL